MMITNRKKSAAKKKLYAGWYDDGAAEIGTGVLLLLLGVYYITLENLRGRPVIQSVTALLLPVLILIWRFFLGKVVRKFKKRITARRTGYISFRNTNKRNRIIRAAAAGLLFGVRFDCIVPLCKKEPGAA